MGLTEGIRECVADVYVQTTDIRTGVITTDCLGGSAVTTAKLQQSAVTNAIIAMECGRWYGGLLSTAGLTNSFTFTTTNACTILDFILQVTAGASAGVLGVRNTGTDYLFTCSITFAIQLRNFYPGAVSGVGSVTSGCTVLLELSAGGSIIGVCSGAATANDLRGKYFVHYISTPS